MLSVLLILERESGEVISINFRLSANEIESKVASFRSLLLRQCSAAAAAGNGAKADAAQGNGPVKDG